MTVSRSRFISCTAEKGGGGVSFTGARPRVDNCQFEDCTTSYLYGGGAICASSSPVFQLCRFNRCTASKEGGGIWWDDQSRPQVLQTQFMGCLPSQMRQQR